MFYDVMAYGNQVKETAKKHRKEKDTATSDEFSLDLRKRIS